MIDDGFGDRPDPEILLDYEKWLHRVANNIGRPEQHDDLVQEGRIAMWRALATYDSSKGALPSWITTAAEMRMRTLAWGRGQPFGRPETRGSREVDLGPSLDALEGDQVESLLGYVEEAYQDGEILEAIRKLPKAQQEYVFLRFWGGLDPMAKAPGIRALVLQFPAVRDRRNWTEAKASLLDALEHLRAA